MSDNMRIFPRQSVEKNIENCGLVDAIVHLENNRISNGKASESGKINHSVFWRKRREKLISCSPRYPLQTILTNEVFLTLVCGQNGKKPNVLIELDKRLFENAHFLCFYGWNWKRFFIPVEIYILREFKREAIIFGFRS